MISTLYYFVDDTETSFVANDIYKLSSLCNKLVLFSTEHIPEDQNFPDNVLIMDEYIDWKNFNSRKILKSDFFSILGIYIREIYQSGKLLPFRFSMALLCSNLYKASEIERRMSEAKLSADKDSVLYAFWFYDNIYLSFLSEKLKIRHVYCRAHGGDLFEERSSLYGKPLFRNFQLQKFSSVFSVSEIGTNYLRKKYVKYADKIKTAYLGSAFHTGINHTYAGEFVLVSCAKIRDIKRIYLIAEALMHIDFPITWYHLGDENLNAENDPTIAIYKKNVEALKHKSNIVFKAPGQLDNKAIFDFYTHNPVDLFISVSAAEGIPVSMMEAISFGIPVLSTDVGACSEIVNDTTGKLLSANPDSNEIAEGIRCFTDTKYKSESYRAGVRNFWETHFNEDTNYRNFKRMIHE